MFGVKSTMICLTDVCPRRYSGFNTGLCGFDLVKYTKWKFRGFNPHTINY